MNWKRSMRLMVGMLLGGLGMIAALPVRGQGQAGPPGWNRALTRAYESFDGFSSVADWRVLDRGGKETVRLRIGFAKLKEHLRLEIDLNQMKSAELQPQTLAAVKQLGMDRMVVVVTPSRNMMRMIYPALGSYVEMPLPEEVGGGGKNLKSSTTRLGQEKIDGRVCLKQKTTLQGGPGDRFESLEWLAPDLKNFPLQVQLQDRETTVILRCSGVQLALPDARQFNPPPNFRKYTDVTELMADSAKRVMGAAAPKAGARPAPSTNRPSGQPLRPPVTSTNRQAGRAAGTTTNRTATPSRPR